ALISDIRLAGDGWVDNSSGGLDPPRASIFFHNVKAALGSYPALAANSTPIRSASASWDRLLGKANITSFNCAPRSAVALLPVIAARTDRPIPAAICCE